MPYNDQQIEYLKSLDPSVAQGLIGKMTDAQRTDFSNSMTAYSNRKAQAAQAAQTPFTGASDVGTAHATPPAQTEEQSMIAARTGGGGFGQFPAGTEAESQQAARNRAFLPYAWNTPQHVVNSWVDKVIPPTPKMQAQDADWWAQRNAAEAQSSAPGVASMINPLSLAGGRGLRPSTLVGRLGAGAAGGGLYRATQPNASIYNIAGSAALGLGTAGAGEMISNEISNEISNYLNRGAQTQNGAYISPSVGYNPQTASTSERALKQIVGSQNVLLPPEILEDVKNPKTTGSVAGLMKQASQEPDLWDSPTISDIQQRSQGTGMVKDKAEDLTQRLTVAAAREHGVDLSLGDISGDKGLREREQALESKPGSQMNEFRQKQGAQLRQAIMNLGDQKDKDAYYSAYDFANPNNMTNPSLLTQLKVDQAAHAQGMIGSNPTEAEILAQKVHKQMTEPSMPGMIQLSLEGQYWQNRQIAEGMYAKTRASVADALKADPTLPKTVDVSPVQTDLKNLIKQNEKSPAYDSDLATKLNTYLTNLSRKGVDLSYQAIKDSVTQMEGTIADLGQSGNRNLARQLQAVKGKLDLQAENYAKQVLKNDPEALGQIGQNDAFYKDKVVPYFDPDYGISNIMRGKDADLTVRPYFTETSPDQFKRIFDKLDSKGQAAVRAEMVGRTEDAASRMKNFQSMNLPSFARYLENRSDQVNTAYGEDQSLPGLAHLIRNTPRAGYQSKLEPLFDIHSVGKLAGKSAGALAGGISGNAIGGPGGALIGAGLGTAAESGLEMGVNNVVSKHLINPDITRYIDPKSIWGANYPLGPNDIPMGPTPPPPGPGTGMGPGGRWVGEQRSWRDTVEEQPRYGGTLSGAEPVEHAYDTSYSTRGSNPWTITNPLPNTWVQKSAGNMEDWLKYNPRVWVDPINPTRTLNLDTSPSQLNDVARLQQQRNIAKGQLRNTASGLAESQTQAGQNRTMDIINDQFNHQVSATPSYYDLNNGVLSYNSRAANSGLIKKIQTFSSVDIPTHDEMNNALSQLKNQLNDLMAGGRHNILGEQISPSERMTEVMRTKTDIQNLTQYMKTGVINPDIYKEQLVQYNDALQRSLEDSYRRGGGDRALKQKIEQLMDQRDLAREKLIATNKNLQTGMTKVNQTADLGGGQWQDAMRTTNPGPRSIGNLGGGHGMDLEESQRANPDFGGFNHVWNGMGASSQGNLPSLNLTIPHYAEPGYSQTNAPMELGQNTHQIPILSEAPTKPGSVGAARHNPYDNGGDELAKANRVREELEQKLAANAAAKALTGQTKGAVERLSVQGQIVTPTPTSIGKTSISTGESELDAARAKMVQAQKDADRIAAAKSQVGPRMQPNPLSDNPFPPLPEPPAGKLAQVKAWLRSTLGMNPPLETTAPPAWAPLKEPTNVYMPTRSIGEAQGQLTEATEQYNTAQAKAEAAKPHGPLANPIWRREHEIVGPIELAQNPIPGTGEDPHAEVSDEELVRRVERDDPLLTKIRRKLQFTDVQKEGEEMGSGTTEAEQIAAANAELTKHGEKVFSTPSGQKLDKAVTLKLLAGYGDSINHLKVEQNAEIARAQSLDASPDQLRTLSTAHEIDLKKHQDWLKDAINYVNKEDWSAYTKHLQRRP